jgi:hypothetical protein
VKDMLRIACVIAPISYLLVAASAYSAEPPKPVGATPSTTTAPTDANEAAPAAAQAAAVPSANTGEHTVEPVAPKPAPEPQASTTSVAVSPYGPSSSSTSQPPPQAQSPQPPKPYDGPPTLWDSSADYAIGGFGGVGVMYTRIARENAVQVCGEGALIIDHKLTLGGGGCGITTMINAYKYGSGPHDPNDRMTFGYGGAIIRYHLFSHRIVNLGVGALIGAGGVGIGTWDGSGNDWDNNYTHKRSEAVFVFEPQIGAFTNVTRWLRLGANVGYRIVSGVNTQGLSASDLSAPTIGGMIQGGWF